MLRFLTAGESHGPSLTAILEGMPAGVPLTPSEIDHDLARRQRGFGSGARMKIERDRVRITAGVMNGRTTGAPIAFVVENLDYAKWKERDIPPMTIPRPGHADLTGAVKYGYRELRLALERASARETTMRVAVGAACRALLRAFGIEVVGYVVSIGAVSVPNHTSSPDPEVYRQRFAQAEASDVRCYDPETAEQMRAHIRAAMEARDTLGGVIEVAALNVPPGLGSHVHWDRRLSARLAQAAMSVHAVKGVEIGDGFAEARVFGTQAQDALYLDGDVIRQRTNHAGGIEGGITNGAPIVLRAALKPIATTLNPLDSVDLATGQAVKTQYERSDFCQVPRAVPILEAMVCFVLADALLEKLGGDSLEEMLPRFQALRRLRLRDLPMDNQPWRFGYAD
ncbi:MAG: chorismate synthase [Anaerolineae bacterium]|nr:chorismate synthase [Thermoflexales bacterium]MDW8054272.1 chorismate synthase [Anaerolineae bacterium]MDW8291566.1 chorismate synthase [Anaerolineae bacterium]